MIRTVCSNVHLEKTENESHRSTETSSCFRQTEKPFLMKLLCCVLKSANRTGNEIGSRTGRLEFLPFNNHLIIPYASLPAT